MGNKIGQVYVITLKLLLYHLR